MRVKLLLNQDGAVTVFQDSLDELLISLGAVNPQNTNIVTVNKIKEGMFVYINPQKKCSNKHNTCSKRYFNSDCYMKRKAYRKSKKYYYRVCSNENYCDMVCRCKEYKKTIQKQFNEFQKSFVNKLRGLRTSDPNAYWSCNKSKTVTQKVALNVFFNHFIELSNMQNDVDIVLPDNISEYNTVINETISEKEVTDAIKSL